MNKRNKVPKEQEKRQDWLRSHGESELGSQRAGLQIVAPLTAYGSRLPPGSEYSTPEGTIRVYDGVVRQVDHEVFRHEVDEHIKRKRDIEKLALDLIEAGDNVAAKYLVLTINCFWKMDGKKWVKQE